MNFPKLVINPISLLTLLSTMALLAIAPPLQAQSSTSFSSLEERMSFAEFSEAGLVKLSPEELAALNDWIRARSLAENETPADTGDSLPDRPSELPALGAMAREPFQTRIAGKFNGWTGDTEFELENGMVWRQVSGADFFVPEIENPTVTIKPSMMSSWTMSVEGYNSKVRVKRIR